MTEIYVKKGEGIMRCSQCFPGRLHLIIDFPENEFPKELLDSLAFILNPLGIKQVLLDQ